MGLGPFFALGRPQSVAVFCPSVFFFCFLLSLLAFYCSFLFFFFVVFHVVVGACSFRSSLNSWSRRSNHERAKNTRRESSKGKQKTAANQSLSGNKTRAAANNMALAGKHVLVNGAWGAGAAIARHARARGAKVSVIVDALETTFLGKSEEDVAAAKDALLGQDGEGPAVNFLHCNSNDLESLKACCQAAGQSAFLSA